MTASEIIAVVRRLLQDTVSPYRWTDAEICDGIQFGITELHKIRPETRYVWDDELGRVALVDRVVLPDSTTEEIDIDSRYMECLAYYACYMALQNDSSDTANFQLAESYLTKFNAKAQL